MDLLYGSQHLLNPNALANLKSSSSCGVDVNTSDLQRRAPVVFFEQKQYPHSIYLAMVDLMKRTWKWSKANNKYEVLPLLTWN